MKFYPPEYYFEGFGIFNMVGNILLLAYIYIKNINFNFYIKF